MESRPIRNLVLAVDPSLDAETVGRETKGLVDTINGKILKQGEIYSHGTLKLLIKRCKPHSPGKVTGETEIEIIYGTSQDFLDQETKKKPEKEKTAAVPEPVEPAAGGPVSITRDSITPDDFSNLEMYQTLNINPYSDVHRRFSRDGSLAVSGKWIYSLEEQKEIFDMSWDGFRDISPDNKYVILLYKGKLQLDRMEVGNLDTHIKCDLIGTKRGYEKIREHIMQNDPRLELASVRFLSSRELGVLYGAGKVFHYEVRDVDTLELIRTFELLHKKRDGIKGRFMLGLGGTDIGERGTRIVTGTSTIRLWSAETGEHLQVLEPPGKLFWMEMGLSPDENFLAAVGSVEGSYRYTLVVYDLISGKLVSRTEQLDHRPQAIKFSPDNQIVTLQREFNLDVFRANDCGRLPLPGNSVKNHGLAFHPSGSMILLNRESRGSSKPALWGVKRH